MANERDAENAPQRPPPFRDPTDRRGESIEEGAEIELDRLLPATRLALLDMAATVADDFPNDR